MALLLPEPELAGGGLLPICEMSRGSFVVGLRLLLPGLIQTRFFSSSLVAPQLAEDSLEADF